jgi:hypothetical protein
MTFSLHHVLGKKKASCSMHIVEDKVWLFSTFRVEFCYLTGFLPHLYAQRARHTRYGGRGQDAHFYIFCSVTERTPASGTRDAPGHGLRGAARAADALSSLPSSVPRPVGMIFARTRNQAIRYWPMVTRQAHTMSVGVIPGFCIWYGPLVSEQGPAPAPATGGGRLVQRPTRCVASRAQAASRWPPTSHVEREAACCSHNERSVSQ